VAHPGGGGVFSTVIFTHMQPPLLTLEPRTHTADEAVDAKVRVLAVGLSPAGGLRTRHCNTSAGRSTAKQIVAAQARPTPTMAGLGNNLVQVYRT
jgi:hypothetical protein